MKGQKTPQLLKKYERTRRKAKTIIAGRMKEVEKSIRIMQRLQEKPKDSPQSKKREI
ncbi:8643_t:CDS:1, partial [Cetraspora pellucida]